MKPFGTVGSWVESTLGRPPAARPVGKPQAKAVKAPRPAKAAVLPRPLTAPAVPVGKPAAPVPVSPSPVIQRYHVNVKVQAKPAGSSNKLEFHNGTDGYTGPTVIVYGNRRAVAQNDIDGDIVSHYLARGVDPVLTGYYNQFVRSLTPQQQKNLRSQYVWARQHDGETRPYQQWATMAGIPAYFRGYAFHQWANPGYWYTPQQLRMFDAMVSYLKTGYKA